jgi:ABC-type sulfate transport system substrate-binding protein
MKTLVLIGVSSLLCLMILGNAKMAQTEQKVNYQNPSSSSNEKRTELNDVQFEPKSAVHGYTKEHSRFSSETWEASDGVAIFLRREYCGSAKEC